MDTSELANRMKDYEKRNRYYLQKRLPVIIRLDSRAGHTFTKGFKRPFDEIFIKSMQVAAQYLCENIQGCQCAYIQSDEITLLLVDYEKLNTDSWFDYRTDKIISISAAMATLAFNKYFTSNAEMYIDNFYETWNYSDVEEKYVKVLEKAIKMGLVFDSRVFNLPKEEVTNNFYWRQLDCSRNSIQMVGQANFSHKELQHKSCNDIQDMLMTHKGINWNDFPTYQKRGSCVIKEYYWIDANDGCEYSKEYSEVLNRIGGCETDIMRSRWIIDKDIPIFKGDGREYIERLVNVGEA